jgi:hypothetical protein
MNMRFVIRFERTDLPRTVHSVDTGDPADVSMYFHRMPVQR